MHRMIRKWAVRLREKFGLGASAYASRDNLFGLLTSFWRRSAPQGSRVLTPAQARAQYGATTNVQSSKQSSGPAQGQASVRPRPDGDGRQAGRHAYLAAH